MQFNFISVILSLVVLYIFVRLCGYLAKFSRQPSVIGEIIAGFLLSSAVFGAFFPDIHQTFFSKNLQQAVDVLGSMGIALYVFTLGFQAQGKMDKSKNKEQFWICFMGLAVPLTAGFFLAPLFSDPGLKVSVEGSHAFFAIAIAVTAFPVLMRILESESLIETSLGKTALATAALNDLVTWALLGILFAIEFQSQFLWSKFLSDSAVVLSFFVGRRFSNIFRKSKEQPLILQTFSLKYLVPFFFVAAGSKISFAGAELSTELLPLLSLIALGITVKLVPTLLVSRLFGRSLAAAFAMAVLLNTRGLVELAVIKMGLQLGFISEKLYGWLFLMTLVTTLATVPIIRILKSQGAQFEREA